MLNKYILDGVERLAPFLQRQVLKSVQIRITGDSGRPSLSICSRRRLQVRARLRHSPHGLFFFGAGLVLENHVWELSWDATGTAQRHSKSQAKAMEGVWVAMRNAVVEFFRMLQVAEAKFAGLM